MPRNTEHRERLTEMLTLVVTPSARARIQELADRQANGAYSQVARRYIMTGLDAEDPRTDAELKVLGEKWLAAKNDKKEENGHA
jgi:hypothetical protein